MTTPFDITNVRLRTATGADQEAVEGMFDAFAIEQGKSLMAAGGAESGIGADLKNGRAHVLLAEIDGKPIGFAQLTAAEDPLGHEFLEDGNPVVRSVPWGTDGAHVSIEKLFVTPEVRGQRVGELLVAGAFRAAQNAGADELSATVYKEDGSPRIMDLREDFGFRYRHTSPDLVIVNRTINDGLLDNITERFPEQLSPQTSFGL